MLSFLGLVVADAFGMLAFRLADQAWLLLQIGRDILCQGVFTMSFDGHVTFSR